MTMITDPFHPAMVDAATAGRPEMRAVKMDVTPQQARAWLDRHKEVVARNREGDEKARDNRTIRWDTVTTYGRDMANGKWRCNGHTIKIAWDETVPDGRHRLLGCIEAGVPFTTWVVFGCDPEDQDTMDTGMRRKFSDQLTITGERNAITLAAVTRWLMIWQHGIRGGTGRAAGEFKPTNLEMIEFLARNPRLRDATAWAVHARPLFRPVKPSAYAMAWMLLTAVDEEQARTFLENVVTGSDMPKGHPGLAFRSRLINARAIDERLTEAEELALLILAWNFSRAGKSVARLQLPKNGLTPKNFPEPK